MMHAYNYLTAGSEDCARGVGGRHLGDALVLRAVAVALRLRLVQVRLEVLTCGRGPRRRGADGGKAWT